MKWFCRSAAIVALAIAVLVFGTVWYTDRQFPDSVQLPDVGDVENGNVSLRFGRQANAYTNKQSYEGKWTLWGIVPVKRVQVTTDGTPTVRVCGTPFGIKLYTDGVLIVGLTAVDSALGSVNPASQAGLEIGDRLLSINGQEVTDNEQVSRLVASSGGKTLVFRAERDGVTFEARVTPAKSLTDDGYHAGMWVRDSAAGVGMLTFYDPLTGVCGGLGHAICDRDTGLQLSMAGGELVPATVFDIVKGTAGEAGVLCGTFAPGSLGVLAENSDCGIYGVLTRQPADAGLYEIAAPYEVETGQAQLLCTLGNTPAWYDVEITKVSVNEHKQSMVLRVTDPDLLEQTGGIVQGMSGSPLVQNGKLIGAVTHVLVNDPTSGYAIFAQTMYEKAQAYAGTAPAELPRSVGGVTVSISPDAA